MASKTSFRRPHNKSVEWETDEQLATEETIGGVKNNTRKLLEPTMIDDGTRDVAAAGTRLALSATLVECREVAITGKSANTGYIYVGGAMVSSTRYLKRLAADETIVLGIDNLSKIYLDSSVSGEGVLFGYVR